MKTLLIYGPGDENCKQTLVHLLLDRLERYSLIETAQTSLYSSVVSEPDGSRTGSYADSGAHQLIKVSVCDHERADGIKNAIQLAVGSEGLIILGAAVCDYPEADFKVAVAEEGDDTDIPDADYTYRLREDLDELITRILPG